MMKSIAVSTVDIAAMLASHLPAIVQKRISCLSFAAFTMLAVGGSVASAASEIARNSRVNVILKTPISSLSSKVGDEFAAVSVEPIRDQDNNPLSVSGAEFKGRITAVKQNV